ncbi:MAG: transposase [Flavobacteriales bacterium]|nr:transposase [Flavobacteriales bacterium]
MKSKRQSTVEPVFGTLTQFFGLRKINTLGIKPANKVMHLSAIAYNTSTSSARDSRSI